MQKSNLTIKSRPNIAVPISSSSQSSKCSPWYFFSLC